MKLHILYKVCDCVNSFNHCRRPLGLDKKALIRACLPTVKKAMEPLDHYFSVIGDFVSAEIMDLVVSTLNPKNVYNAETHLGYINTMLKASEFATETADDDIVFMLEEDYAVDYENFAPRLMDFLTHIQGMNLVLPWFIHPSDYQCQYNRLMARSYLLRTPLGYWREVSSTTETWMCQAKTYKQRIDFFRECNRNGDTDPRGSDGCISSIFKKEALCWSPLPGLTTHMAEGFICPFVDWRRLLGL